MSRTSRTDLQVPAQLGPLSVCPQRLCAPMPMAAVLLSAIGATFVDSSRRPTCLADLQFLPCGSSVAAGDSALLSFGTSHLGIPVTPTPQLELEADHVSLPRQIATLTLAWLGFVRTARTARTVGTRGVAQLQSLMRSQRMHRSRRSRWPQRSEPCRTLRDASLRSRSSAKSR
jgi:hypothetical protein